MHSARGRCSKCQWDSGRTPDIVVAGIVGVADHRAPTIDPTSGMIRIGPACVKERPVGASCGFSVA